MRDNLNMASSLPDDLSRFLFAEEQILRGDFREYVLRKRYNFIVTINNLKEVTDLFLHVDHEWMTAITALEHIRNDDWLVPAQLTIFCLRELCLSAELLLSCCTTPGFSHLRSAIEAFAQAQKIIREPTLGAVWLSREQDRVEYDKYFTQRKQENLFPEMFGLRKLHLIWQMLCDSDPHPNVTTIGVSSSLTESAHDVVWALNFFEVSNEELSKNMLLMIMCSLEMFKFTYNAFHDRLSLAPDLLHKLHSHLARFAELKNKYAPDELS